MELIYSKPQVRTFTSRLGLYQELKVLTSVFVQTMASKPPIKPPKNVISKVSQLYRDNDFSYYCDIDIELLS